MSYKSKCCMNHFIFPIRIQFYTEKHMESPDFRTRYKAYRNFSSAYIGKREVRNYFLEKHNKKCALCGSSENLHIDHIVDVYTCARERIDYRCTNCERNLRVLCSKCNESKSIGSVDSKYLTDCEKEEIKIGAVQARA